jgi:pyrimidine deaminase RibD-like protein
MADLGVIYGKTLYVGETEPCNKSEKTGCSANSLWWRCLDKTKLNRVCFTECENNKNKGGIALVRHHEPAG